MPRSSPSGSSKDAQKLCSFAALKALTRFERRHLTFIKTLQDRDVVLEIGCHQERGELLTMKSLLLAGIGSPATIERRVRRMKRLGAIHQVAPHGDGRGKSLELTAKSLAIYTRYWRLQRTLALQGE